MSSIDNQFIASIKAFKRRICASSIIKYAMLFSSYALAAGLLIYIVSIFLPIYGVYMKCGYLLVIFIVFGIAFGIYKSPGLKEVALKIDSIGLKERVVTAMELIGDEFSMAMLQKKDALEHLKNVGSKKIPLLPDKKYIMLCFILFVSLAATGFIKNPMGDIAKMRHNFQVEKDGQISSVEKIEKELKNSNALTTEDKREIEEKLAELKKEINESESIEEVKKALNRGQKKIELSKKKYDASKEDLQKAIDIFSKTNETEKVADAMEGSDAKASSKEIKKLSETLKNMDGSSKKRISKDFKDISSNLKSTDGLEESLNKAADDIDAEGSIREDDLDNLANSLESLVRRSNASDAVKKITDDYENMNGGEKGNGEQNQQESVGAPDGGSGKEGASGESGQNSKGQGASGSSGSDGEDMTPQGTDGNSISHKDGSEKKVGEYEKVYAPENLGGNGEQSYISGKPSGSGNVDVEKSDYDNADRGESIPYNKVYGEYKEQAMEDIGSSRIPNGMKEIVKGYFSSLEE
ncbi:MAG: hypothetical protein QME45_13590 [Clostridiales bacterium]|nr:hypothetical protein [Clostridiales bacterium]